MRNGFHPETETASEAMRRKFTADADAIVQRAQAERTSTSEKTEAVESTTVSDQTVQSEEKVLWSEVRRELVMQNLFAPREHCKRMVVTSLISIGTYLVLFTILSGMRFNRELGFVIMGVPVFFLAIASSYYLKGGYTSALPDQKVIVHPDGKNEVLSETTIKAAAILQRDRTREKARWGDFLFWIGVGLALFFLFGLPGLIPSSY